MMVEYALTKDGKTVSEFRRFKSPPSNFGDHPTRGNWLWLVVDRKQPVEGENGGTTIDLEGGTVTIQPPLEAVPPRKVGSYAEFSDLFSPEQQKHIDIVAAPGSALSLLLKRALAQNQIDLGSPLTAVALDEMITDSIIIPAEKDIILATDFNNVT